MITPLEMKVLMNHIYEYQKGVRQMVLFTCPKRYEEVATQRLQSQHIEYVLQPAGKNNLNLYFGRKECLDAIRLIVTRPLNEPDARGGFHTRHDAGLRPLCPVPALLPAQVPQSSKHEFIRYLFSLINDEEGPAVMVSPSYYYLLLRLIDYSSTSPN